MRRYLLKRARNLLSRYGYEIKKKRGFSARYLAELCNPHTVLDVGVGYGTPELYKAFPNSFFLLVEPITEYRVILDHLEILKDYKVIYKAVDEAVGVKEILVDTQDFQKSSFNRRISAIATNNQLERRQIEVTTLDEIFRDNPEIESPVLLKVDTEGYELNALRGATELLSKTEVVIAEVTVAPRFEGGYFFEELHSFMNANGLYVYDFLHIEYGLRRTGAQYVDVIFKRR
jgi:FkbM family methyltransferase